jgi:D-alanine-D-alanine ligase
MSAIVVAHNAVRADDDPSTRDVLAQVEFVTGGLESLGIGFEVVAVEDAGAVGPLPAGSRAVVNLVESPPGRPRFQIEAAAALERLSIAFTGSSSAVIEATTDKEGTRRSLASKGLSVAPGGILDPDDPVLLDRVQPPWILKPALEDASLGLEAGAVTSDRGEAVARARELRSAFSGQPVLVEHLLPGREFNVSLLAGDGGPEVLPPAEMTFVDYPPDEPRIVGFKAKWDVASFEYTHTIRRFLPLSETDLYRELEALAVEAWHALSLAGYGRVDVRLDENQNPCVLEVNANPCISADAGFAAAAAAAGYGPPDVVRRILAAAGWRL